MKITKTSEVKIALDEMKGELSQFKRAAEDFMNDIKDVSPEEISLDEGFEGEINDGDGEKEFGEEEKEPKIETPEDAKKVLDEAKEDIQSVIDNIEGVIGQGEEEVEKVAFKRINSKYANTLSTLSNSADKAIKDAKDSLKHWAFLKKRIKRKESKIDTSQLTHPELKQVANTIEQMSLLDKLLAKAGYIKKSNLESTATAVPPTGAKDTGDKWPGKGNPADIEQNQWEAGTKEFHKNRKKEDALPNPAIDPRLKDEGNPRGDDGPYVNAYNDLGRHYDVYDGKTKRAFRFSFANAPEDMGRKDTTGLKLFASKKFANDVCDAVMERGIESVRKETNGQYLKEASIVKQAATDKGSVRKYYAEAFGDAQYAKDLTSGKDNSSMDIGYTPEKNKVENNEDNPEFGKAKDGPGKISKKDESVLKAKAARGLELCRLAAAAGVIPFDKPSFKKYAMGLMDKSDETIDTLESTFSDMDLVNEAALKEATIPDADSGIVGNRLSGVSDPKGTSETEGLDTEVGSDAKIAKQASFVPQVSTVPPTLKLSSMFTTVEKTLQEKGVDVSSLRLRTAKRKTH